VLGYFTRKFRHRRAQKYLAAHPDDEPAVQTIVAALDLLAPKSAREVAEMTAARQLSDAEWQKFGPRWERAWNAIR
jgi:hypothetical protein